jgi:hypothetical protein
MLKFIAGMIQSGKPTKEAKKLTANGVKHSVGCVWALLA